MKCRELRVNCLVISSNLQVIDFEISFCIKLHINDILVFKCINVF
jgi:hypothetical protein